MASGSGMMSLMQVNASKGQQRTAQASKEKSRELTNNVKQKVAEAKNIAAEKSRASAQAAYKVTIDKGAKPLSDPAMPNLSPALQEYMRVLNF